MKEHYEMLKEERNILRNERTKLYKENENKLKAFEIIKEKRVDIVTLLDSRNAEAYNRWIDTRSHYTYRPYEITQEEYDLLKEVLL